MNEDDVRDLVAEFILCAADDPECLFEPVQEAYSDSLGDGVNDPEYSTVMEDNLISMAYAMHARAKVQVVIDEVVYEG